MKGFHNFCKCYEQHDMHVGHKSHMLEIIPQKYILLTTEGGLDGERGVELNNNESTYE